ncbi:MAG: hypothetical protein IKM31_09670 [Oscillospiraceae bacterium]|nr:hypothetical protein [Oscillospiraceae bacterium]
MAILDIFGKKKAGETPEAETPAAAPAEETTPDISVSKAGEAARKTLTGPQAETLKKIESIARALYEGKRECYLILDGRTTLEDFEAKKNIRPMITGLNPQNRVPVIHFATGEMVAEQIAREMGCVVEDKPLIIQIPFPALFRLLNDLSMAGIFGFVAHEVGKHYAGSTAHLCSYVLGELEKKDPRPFMDQIMTVQSLHQMRAIKGRFYVVANPGTTIDDAKAGQFTLAAGTRGGRPFTTVFATKALAEEFVSRAGGKSIIVEMNGQQMVDKLAEMRNRLDAEYVVLYAEPRGAHPQPATIFIAMCCDILKAQRPKINIRPQVTPEVITMDGAEEAEAPVEEVTAETPVEETPVEEAPAAEEKTEE